VKGNFVELWCEDRTGTVHGVNVSDPARHPGMSIELWRDETAGRFGWLSFDFGGLSDVVKSCEQGTGGVGGLSYGVFRAPHTGASAGQWCNERNGLDQWGSGNVVGLDGLADRTGLVCASAGHLISHADRGDIQWGPEGTARVDDGRSCFHGSDLSVPPGLKRGNSLGLSDVQSSPGCSRRCGVGSCKSGSVGESRIGGRARGRWFGRR
jgi:hypothetical protein